MPQWPSGGMAVVGSMLGPSESSRGVGPSALGVSWEVQEPRAAACGDGGPRVGRCLHISSRRADSSRASLTRVHRQAYARFYPMLLVKQDGSTIHIRYREPRRVLAMPVDLDALSPDERRARFRKREAQLRGKEEKEPELLDNFDLEQYKQFWTKK
ncbi:hypothetical protein QTO34_015125 [Cnephaeus nilssonii]|uniref:Mitochondrial ribosomal protein L55 n=1 Tax=Cnephaeus nilssonii TaxID=3371016 RepID=A0AA40LQF0_CNENI|nr:hypothetical protein QTO34_015125 [Eptesicus nilssonii]